MRIVGDQRVPVDRERNAPAAQALLPAARRGASATVTDALQSRAGEGAGAVRATPSTVTS